MELIMLEHVLLEADAVNINSSPDKMNQSKVATRRSADYTISDDQEMAADDADETADDEPDQDSTNDYTETEDEADTADDQTGQDSDEESSDDGESEESQGDESTDYTDEEGNTEDDSSDDSSADDAEEGESTDYTDEGDDSDAEGNDDDTSGTDDSDMGSDSGSDGAESEEELKQRDTKVRQFLLLKNMVRLYHYVKSYANRILSLEKGNVLFTHIQRNAYYNFTKLHELIFNYIHFYYSKMSYEYNLYIYNYLIEACKVNAEMLDCIANKDEVVY